MTKDSDMSRDAQGQGSESLAKLKTDIEHLKAEHRFAEARKLLSKATKTHARETWVQQQLALCTYKDEELAPWTRHRKALDILEGVGLRDPGTDDSETLALGGAVFKRMWEYGGQLEHLYEALVLYRAAYERNPSQDMGYGGVNAAYILDLLASRARAAARRGGVASADGDLLAREATGLREAMRNQLAQAAQEKPNLHGQYWFLATQAEVLFGLGAYEKAGELLENAAGLDPSEWQLQTTFRQLASLARCQGVTLREADPSTKERAWGALARLLGEDAERVLPVAGGKVGLALSGGGFRAAFFHLGVLARLAEMDVLRSVEVLSAVSGGSVVGAQYYLEVRRLLNERADRDIGHEDYIEIVRRVMDGFLQGVQRNLRTRVVSNTWRNLRMLLPLGYTRTHRLGELYESELYARVDDEHLPGRPRTMSELLVQPPPSDSRASRSGFKPKFDNWRRRTKVPILLLNTTSLNSGHNWHFTATWMGEPPGLLGDEVDKNARYRRLYYRKAPSRDLRNFRLGYAVAASSCVPALFEPLEVEGLYRGSVVRLVDGGVHDNQGVSGLLDEGCTVILCSDASGQMGDDRNPGDGLLSVLTRAGSIQGDRIREAEYQDLKGRLGGGSLQGLFSIHLKKDLEVHPLDWIGCEDPIPKPVPCDGLTSYGVAPDLQERIARVRTDLDSFTEVEACSLMCSGYLMAGQQFRALRDEEQRDQALPVWGEFQVDAGRGEWFFLRLEPILGTPEARHDPRREKLSEQLEAASQRAFKVWRLNPTLRIVSYLGMAIAAIAFVLFVWLFWDRGVEVSVGTIVLALGAAILGAVFPVWKLLSPEEAKRSIAMKIGTATFGYLAAKVHLWVFDRWFLKQGTLDRLFERNP